MASSSFTRFLVSTLQTVKTGILNGTRRIMDKVLSTGVFDGFRTAPEVPLADFLPESVVVVAATDGPAVASVVLEAHKASESIRPTAISLVVIRPEDTMPTSPAEILTLRTAFGTTDIPPVESDDQAETTHFVSAPIAGLFKGRESKLFGLKYAIVVTYPDPTPDPAPATDPSPTPTPEPEPEPAPVPAGALRAYRI